MNILIAGFQHETNTFAPSKADYPNFERGEGFPAMVRGEALLALRDVNIPAGGFIQAAEAAGHSLIPVIWAGASPSAHVTETAYERIANEILEAACAETFDAIYLDLHGAMVAEHTDDGEGTLLRRLREIVGNEMPVVVSLDLHANVTHDMLTNASALVAYRTYPHVDMAETGTRAAGLLERLFAGETLHCASRRLPFLIPINGMCTLLEPACSFYAGMEMFETKQELSLSFAPGFPAADFPECGPVIWGYGNDESVIVDSVEQLYERMLAEEALWEVPFLSPDEAVRSAIEVSASARRPVVIADTQDNPGAGGDSNTMGMLKALLANKAQDAAIGLIFDPSAAAKAHAAGIGATLTLALAGDSGVAGDSPLEGTFEVEYLSDGMCRYDGPMMNGMTNELGPVACLRIGGVRIVVSSTKAQMLDRNLYRIAGVEPERMKILVNKSSVHFRADFQPIAEAVLVAKAPGPMLADPADLPWTRLAPGIRMKPMGPVFQAAQ
ncbi:M81 family metallopeptidase [Pseudomonas matsuisoli]|uniref:Microcystinase C n=1 Tax=Pseudomonas matsuisoli TaxID=1515666 RepID=A0A917PI27_9PSED|nr:M81 family metallopeptidase [Pseudomonas matsuisoli]GGJ78853.1 microcystinase C [Pseudomonas matsuisoli]